MRLTSEIWVAAQLRAANAETVRAHLVRRGAAEAGAVFVVLDHLNRRYSLFGPAPQSAIGGSDDPGSDRVFECLMRAVDRGEIAERLRREERMDGDFWVIEWEWTAGSPPDALAVIRET